MSTRTEFSVVSSFGLFGRCVLVLHLCSLLVGVRHRAEQCTAVSDELGTSREAGLVGGDEQHQPRELFRLGDARNRQVHQLTDCRVDSVLRSRGRLRSRSRSRSQRREFRPLAISRVSMMDARSAQALACACGPQSSRTAVQGEADRKRGVSGACDNVPIRPPRDPNGLRRPHRLRRRR